MGTLSTVFMTVIFLGLLVTVVLHFDDMVDIDIRRGHVCGGMTPTMHSIGYECCSACEDAGMTFVKYEHDIGGMFHATVDDCHCRVNDTYVQIW